MQYETPESIHELLVDIGAVPSISITDDTPLVDSWKLSEPDASGKRILVKIPGVGLTLEKLKIFDFSTIPSEKHPPLKIWKQVYPSWKTVGDARKAINSLI